MFAFTCDLTRSFYFIILEEYDQSVRTWFCSPGLTEMHKVRERYEGGQKGQRKVVLVRQTNSTGKGDISTSKVTMFWWPAVIFKHHCLTMEATWCLGTKDICLPHQLLAAVSHLVLGRKLQTTDLRRLQSHFGDRMMQREGG